MAFKIPAMPLTANVWQAQGGILTPPVGAPTLTVRCQLRLTRQVYATGLAGALGAPTMMLVVPKGTDIRPPHATNVRGDMVECPAGTGRFYSVLAVDDAAKGFANEFRVALMTYNPNRAGLWPFPTP